MSGRSELGVRVGSFKLIWSLCAGLKWLIIVRINNKSLCGRSKLTLFRCRDRVRLRFSGGGVEITLVLSGSKLTWFWCLYQNWLDYIVGIKIGLISVLESKRFWFLSGGLKWFRFWGGNRLTWFSCGWSIITSVTCGETKLTWLQYRDRNWLGICVVVENDPFLMLDWKLACFVLGHRNFLWLRGGIAIALILVLESTVSWFLCGWSNLTWFLWTGGNLLDFSVGIEIDLFFCVHGRN